MQQYEIHGVDTSEFRYVHWYLSSGIVLLLCYYQCSPYLWGKTAVDQFKERQKKGWVLCKQPGMTEVLDMLDKSIVRQSTYNFPIDISLEVHKLNVH